MWSGKENVILTMRPFDQSQSKITAASGNVDQSNQIHILIHRLSIYFMHIDSQRKATQMLRGELNTRSLEKTYQVQTSGTHPK